MAEQFSAVLLGAASIALILRARRLHFLPFQVGVNVDGRVRVHTLSLEAVRAMQSTTLDDGAVGVEVQRARARKFALPPLSLSLLLSRA